MPYFRDDAPETHFTPETPETDFRYDHKVEWGPMWNYTH